MIPPIHLAICILVLSSSPSSIPLLDSLENLKETLEENPDNREIHFRIAEIYLQQREYEKAQNHLRTTLSLNGSGEEEILFVLGRIALKEKKYEEALNHFRKAESQKKGKGKFQEYSFLLGYCSENLSRWEEAIGYYGQSLETLLDDYARFHIGQVLEEMEWTEEAMTVYNTLIQRYPESLHLSTALREIPRLIEKEKKWEEAIAKREEILRGIRNKEFGMENSKLRMMEAEMLTGIAKDLLQLGKNKDGQKIYWEVVRSYPSSSYALEALHGLEDEDWITSRDRFEAGKVHYHHGNYSESIQNFQIFIKKHPRDERIGEAERFLADAHYSAREFEEALRLYRRIYKSKIFPSSEVQILFRIARCEERLGREKEAYNLFIELADHYPNETICDDALYRSGMILEREGEPSGAIPIYERLVLEISKGDFVDDGWYRLGLTALQSGDTDLALFAFQGLLKSPSGKDSPHLPGSLYWIGKIYEGKGDSLRKKESFQVLEKMYPYHYYTQQILERLNDDSLKGRIAFESKMTSTHHPSPITDVPVEDWIGSWAETLYTLNSKEEIRFEKGKRLLEMGLNQEGIRELSAVDEENPLFLYRLALLYKNSGLDYEPLLLSEKIRQQSREKSPLPHGILLLLYPTSYLPTLNEISQGTPKDIPLYLSILRAESGFNPRAVSSVGARGLAQIMPETGEKIAQVLNDTNYHRDDLFEPAKNIRFGTWYINALRDTLKDILNREWENGALPPETIIEPLALAAYNGGPHNVREWVKKGILREVKSAMQNGIDPFLADPSLWIPLTIESIPFFETREFVKRILGFREVYQRLLGSNLQY